jgi:choline dehydrogenase-like flavoprotein
MLSGIGDPAELSEVGIQPIVNLPSVGKNMSDHAAVRNIFEINPNVSDMLQDYLNPAALDTELAQWSSNRTGPLADLGCRQVAWLRLPRTDPIFKTYKDPTPGLRSAHYELIFVVSSYLYSYIELFRLTVNQHGLFPNQQVEPGKKYMTILTNVISPLARGTVSLASSNPFTLPLVNPNLLGSSFDIHVLVYALKAIQRFAQAKPLEGYILGRYGAFGEANTDAELEAYARATAAT